MKSADIQAVEPGGARHDRMERGVQDLGAPPHGPQRFGIVPFHRQDRDEAEAQQRRRSGNGNLGVQRPAPPDEAVGPQILHHRKAERGQDHRDHDRAEDQRVVLKTHHAVRIAGEPCVVERADRMEQAVPYRHAEGFMVGAEQPQGEDHGHEAFHDQGNRKDQPERRHRVVLFQPAAFHLRCHPVAQAEAAPRHQAEQRGRGHDPEPAHLEQQQDHPLSEARPVGWRIDHDQPGDSHGGSGGEYRGQQRRAGARSRRKRQAEQDRAHDDRAQKQQGDQTNRVA